MHLPVVGIKAGVAELGYCGGFEIHCSLSAWVQIPPPAYLIRTNPARLGINVMVFEEFPEIVEFTVDLGEIY